jgi:basic membrane protein A
MSSKLVRAISKTFTIGIIVIIIIAVIAGIAFTMYKPAAPTTTTPAKEYKLAAIFPGTIQDADYNTLGYLAITGVKTKYGIEIAYSERVAVPDSERIMREYISLGYNIIWAHGGQFLAQLLKLAEEYPDVVFIGEADKPLEEPPPNVWIIDRNFHTGFYVLGAIAALSTNTGKIGYIGGIDLPFSKAEVNAILQAIQDYNPDAELIYVWVGDFNDPVKTRSLAESLIAQGVDFILSSVNLGNYGLFEAVKAVSDGKILLTVKYTDKSAFVPDNFVTSYIYDFGVALDYIVGKVMEGEKGGYYKMEFGTACYILLPLKNVPSDIENEAKNIIDQIKQGTLVIEFNPELG